MNEILVFRLTGFDRYVLLTWTY